MYSFQRIFRATLFILSASLLTFACNLDSRDDLKNRAAGADSKQEENNLFHIPGLQRKTIDDNVLTFIKVVDSEVEYFSKQTRYSENLIDSPKSAWEQINILYPDLKQTYKILD